DSAELAPDEAEVAAVSVQDHDEHQQLVEHDAQARRDPVAADESAPAEREARNASDSGSGDDASIEPTVIAPSTLRGPSHSAAHPDDARGSADAAHGEAAESSLEQHPEAGAAGANAADGAEPPALVEPRRPSFGLRRRAD